MMSLAEARILFVAAAGPRRGLPRLLQYLLLARAHGMRPLVAVPGPDSEAETALALGADVLAGATPLLIETLRPDVVVVDDPIAAQNGSWIIAAQRAGALILDVHDLGLEAAEQAAEQFVATRQDPLVLVERPVVASRRPRA